MTVTAADNNTTATYTIDVFRAVSAPTPDPDAVWTANLTVGSNPGGDSLGYSHSGGYGAIAPRQFDHNSESIRVDRLAFDTDNDELAFYWTGDLGSSNYTLQLGGVHLAVLVPGNVGARTIDTSDIDWTVNEIVTVKLFEGLVGVSVSDDATLSSLDFSLEILATSDEFNLSDFLTPSFHPDIPLYAAVVPLVVDVFKGTGGVVPADGATLVLKVNGSDFTNDLIASNEIPLQIGTHELRFTVKAEDRVTRKVYVVRLTRGEPEGLKAWLAVPGSHDGSTPFTVTLGFLDQDISSPLSRVAEAVAVTNGTKGTVTADGSSQRRFLIPVTPTSSEPVRIRVRGAQHCGESHAICAEEIGRVFQEDKNRWVGAADDARLRALWLDLSRYGLWLSLEQLSPGGSAYAAKVPNSWDRKLPLQAAPYAGGATVALTGPAGTFNDVVDRYDGGITAQLDAPGGSIYPTTWTVTVTSADGSETRKYKLTVKRNPPPCYGEGFHISGTLPPGDPPDYRHSNLKTLEVTPAGGGRVVDGPEPVRPWRLRYTVYVTNDTTHVNVSATGASADPAVDPADTRVDIMTGHLTPLAQPVELRLANPEWPYSVWTSVSLRVWTDVGDKCYISHYGVSVVQLPAGQMSLAAGVGPLVGTVQDPPTSHDGSSAFSVLVAFSEDVEITPEDMRDHALLVSGATVTDAARMYGRKDLWELTFAPTGNGPVSILTPLDRACTETGAICTADGRPLAGGLGLWVPSPQPPQANSPATGAPTISGTAQVGETLTADTSGIADADGLTNVSYGYQWTANDGTSDTDIPDATDSTHTLAAAGEGKTIRVRVSFTDDANKEETLTSAATAPVAARPDPGSAPDTPDQPTGTAVFAGGVDLEWDDVPGAASYDVQLFRNGQWTDLPGDGVEIAFYGAGAIISGLDTGSGYWFQVRAGNAHGSSDWSDYLFMTSTNQYELGKRARPDNAPATGAPVITGAAQVGETLTADTAGIADANGLDRVRFRFQWVSNDGSADTDVADAADSSYTLAASDEGRTVRVRVAFTDRGGYAESLTSDATEAVSSAVQQQIANSPATGAPGISGTAQVGETLAADTSGIADEDGLTNVSYGYQWVANDGTSDTDIAGAADSTHTLAAADEGKTIRVRVSFTDDAGYGETLTSAATATVDAAPNSPATGQPVITGTAQVGATLTADTSGIADEDGLTNVSYGYQWVANDGTSDTDITDATGSTHTLAADDEGKTIKVRVSFTDDADNEESLTSAATATVDAAPNSPATGAPGISGTAQVGETLAADTSGIADADGLTNVTFSYQWIANDGTSDADITSATDSTYTLAATDEGKTIRVKVSFTDDADNEESLTSAATATVDAAPNSPATGAPGISGTAQVGETLAADTSGIADEDGLTNVSYSYQWTANDGTSDTDITDATGSTHTLAADDEGKTIKVKVSFTDDADNEESLTSAATATVDAAPNSPATGAPTISGTAQVGETLTADTSGIADADGLTNVSYSYQWLAGDAAIQGATGSSHTLADSDAGKAIRVTASFTDDAGSDETLTSAATNEVASAGPTEPPSPPSNLAAVENADGSVTLAWDAPDDGSVTGYRILRRIPAAGERSLSVHVPDTGSAATSYTDADVAAGTKYVYRVRAINEAGVGPKSRRVVITTSG